MVISDGGDHNNDAGGISGIKDASGEPCVKGLGGCGYLVYLCGKQLQTGETQLGLQVVDQCNQSICILEF